MVYDFADPISFLDLFTSTNSENDGKWKNSTYDKLIADSKTTSSTGRQKYTVPELPNEKQLRFVRVMSDSMVNIEQAQNLIVIKTGSGMAMAAAAALDQMNFPEVVGSIAGDDTIMAAVRTSQDAALLIEKIRRMLGEA